MQLSELSESDIQWWIEESFRYPRKIFHGKPYFTLTTDSSLEGWGAHRDGMRPTGSRWLAQEIAENKHINCLELEADKLGFQTLCAKLEGVHIVLQLDNVTAVTFFNNMGGTLSNLVIQFSTTSLALAPQEEDLAHCYTYPRNTK